VKIPTLEEVLSRLTPERIEEIWQHTWGVGGPHNKGPVNRGMLAELSQALSATPHDAHPSIPAGKALHFLVYRRPFWDCNKRTGWSVCRTIMSAVGYAQAVSDEEVNQLVLDVENGQLNEEETIAAVRRSFRAYRAKS